MAEMKSSQETALITGASSGIGREFARRFAKDGCNLVLIARNPMHLETLANELRLAYGVRVLVIIQDLSRPLAAQGIVDQLSRHSISIDVLVNNAGTQVYGMFTETNLEQQLALIQVNLTAHVHLTHLILPAMIRRGHGRILNVGSTGSFAPGPLNVVYCATKAFVLSFSLALGAELAGTGVTVTALCPGATDTAFITRHGLQDVRVFHRAMPPVHVADIGYRALMRDRHLVVPGFVNQLQVLAFQLMSPFLALTPPAWLLAMGKLFMGRSHTHHQPAQQI